VRKHKSIQHGGGKKPCSASAMLDEEGSMGGKSSCSLPRRCRLYSGFSREKKKWGGGRGDHIKIREHHLCQRLRGNRGVTAEKNLSLGTQQNAKKVYSNFRVWGGSGLRPGSQRVRRRPRREGLSQRETTQKHSVGGEKGSSKKDHQKPSRQKISEEITKKEAKCGASR